MPVFRTPHGGVLGPGGSRVGGSPDVSLKDSGGELGTVARGGDANPFFRIPHGGVLGPGGFHWGDDTKRE